MTQRIQFQSRVGKDGILTVQIPLGETEADAQVLVTIEPMRTDAAKLPIPADQHESAKTTYGSCADLGLEEPPDLPLQQREWAE